MKTISKVGRISLALTCAVMFSGIPAVAEAATAMRHPSILDQEEEEQMQNYKRENWWPNDVIRNETLFIHNFDNDYSKLDALNDIKELAPKSDGRFPWEIFQLYDGNSYYELRNLPFDWFQCFSLPTRTYDLAASEMAHATWPIWTYVGKLTIQHYWNMNVEFKGVSIDSRIASINYQTDGTKGYVASNQAIRVNEGKLIEFTVHQDKRYTTEVRVDNKRISPNPGTTDTYTIEARRGIDEMMDSTVTITYLTDPTQKAAEIRRDDLAFAYIATGNASKRKTLDSLIQAMLNDPDHPLIVRDLDTGKAIEGLTADDFDIDAPGEIIDAGAYDIILRYKGTVGGSAQLYRPVKIKLWAVINADMQWKQEIGSSITQDEVSGTDFGVKIEGTDTSKAIVTTKFYRGVQADEANLIGSIAPTEPGTYTQVTSVDLRNDTYANPIMRTFTIAGEPDSGDSSSTGTPGAGDSGSQGGADTGDADKPGTSGSEFISTGFIKNPHAGHNVTLEGIEKTTTSKAGYILFRCQTDRVDCKIAIPKDNFKVSPAKKVLKASKLKEGKEQFALKVRNAKNEVSFKSLSKKVSVSKKGIVTVKKGTKKGTYKIKVTSKAMQLYAKATKTVKVVVK